MYIYIYIYMCTTIQMLAFGFSGLCMLRQYERENHVTLYIYNSLLQLYISIITIP